MGDLGADVTADRYVNTREEIHVQCTSFPAISQTGDTHVGVLADRPALSRGATGLAPVTASRAKLRLRLSGRRPWYFRAVVAMRPRIPNAVHRGERRLVYGQIRQ